MGKLFTIIGFVLVVSLCSAQDMAPSIPQDEINALQEDLAEAANGRSAVEVRRASKSVIRKALALLESNPEASNKYDILSLLFDGQKRLLALETTDANRMALYETSRAFLDAPDAYAELRFDAEMLLSEKELAESDATVAERIEALKRILAKYRGTPAEWKSLLVGSLVAANLLDFDLEQEITETMSERFGGDHQVIPFLRKKNMGAAVEAIFSGRFQTDSGATLVLPHDLLGFQYMVCFWSQAAPEWEQQLAGIQALQGNGPGRFRVLSCNLDSLPDAGATILRRLELDWIALQLPEGRESSVFQAYATRDPTTLLVNGQGHVVLYPAPMREGGGRGTVDFDPERGLSGIEERLDDDRYLAQLQYIFSGEFLVGMNEPELAGTMGTNGMSSFAADLEAIRQCFVQPPLRYRLPEGAALENYKKAEALCATAIERYPDGGGLWMVRNLRMIALLGMWRMENESAFLDAAVREAQQVLALIRPEGRDLTARFCMATAALREGVDPEVLLADLFENNGGKDSAAMLLSGAVIALKANARKLHVEYRERFLDMGQGIDASLWAMRAFLGDRHHRYRNFHASPGGYGTTKPAKYAFRDMVSGLGEPIDLGRMDTVELARLDGTSIMIPDDYTGELVGIIFVEPLPLVSGGSNLVHNVVDFVESFKAANVKAVVVFLSDKTNLVASLVQDMRLETPAVMLAGGLRHPHIQKWGILSADRIPNVMLLRADGTIAWSISGHQYESKWTGHLHAIRLGIGKNIEKVRCDNGFIALEQRKYHEAIQLFDAFEPAGIDYWASDRHQGRAFAYMGLNDWDSALREIDAAIARRQDDFKSAMCKCHGIVEMCLTKAMILDKLGRTQEAAGQRRIAAAQDIPHAHLPPGLARSGVPVGVYYDWLKTIRLIQFAGGEEIITP